MKISLEWLREFTPGDLDASAADHALTHGGLNVDSAEGAGDAAVLDVEVTSNRGDCLCHAGMAREVAALMARPFRDVVPVVTEEQTDAASLVKVRIDSPLCPHYTARLIRGVRIAPSPPAMQRRLLACGVRPINNVVDVTNYVLLEMGQPLHAFDFAKINGGQIIVRQAAAGEKMMTLDGRQQALEPSMLVIADPARALALAGIMGGADSQVTDATVDVLLESARFDPLAVRRTSRALGLRSESSYRFERGIDPTLPARASLRAAQLICETAGGKLARGMVFAGEEGFQPRTLWLRLPRLTRLIGAALKPEDVVEALASFHLSPLLQGEKVQVQVPSWRLDITIETDLIEEVARLVGYDALPVREEIAVRVKPPDRTTAVKETINQTLVAAGFYQAVTFSFVTDLLQNDFFPAGVKPLRADAAARKADATLRPSLLPGLLEAVQRNEANGTPDARLFETGSVFSASENGKPNEQEKLALVGGADWRDVRGVVEALLARLDSDKSIHFSADERVGYSRGACARVEWDGKGIGFAGQIDQAVADKLSLRHPPMACELDLAALLAGAVLIAKLKPLPQFPPARRDLSLLVAESAPYEQIEQTIRGAAPANLEAIEYVTTFRGKPLEAGTKSVTVTLVFRSDSGTLTSEQIENAVGAAVAAASQKIGATLRQ